MENPKICPELRRRMVNDYQKMHELINEINFLIHMRGAYSSLEFNTWYYEVEQFLIEKYGENSFEIQNFREKTYYMYVSAGEIENSDYDKMCKEGLIETKEILIGYLKEMQDY